MSGYDYSLPCLETQAPKICSLLPQGLKTENLHSLHFSQLFYILSDEQFST